MQNKKVILFVSIKTLLLAVALAGIFYLMSALRSGKLFSDPNSAGAVLFGTAPEN